MTNGMINRVILKGNLGKNPEFKKTKSGKDIAFLSLATNESWKDPSGEWTTQVDWHSITVFKDSTIKWMRDTLKKGDPVYVEGVLKNKEGKDKNGKKFIETFIRVSERDGLIRHMREYRHKQVPISHDFPSNQNTPSFEEDFEDQEKNDLLFNSNDSQTLPPTLDQETHI